MLIPLLLERWTFWDLSNFLVWRKVLPMSEVKASSSWRAFGFLCEGSTFSRVWYCSA